MGDRRRVAGPKNCVAPISYVAPDARAKSTNLARNGERIGRKVDEIRPLCKQTFLHGLDDLHERARRFKAHLYGKCNGRIRVFMSLFGI